MAGHDKARYLVTGCTVPDDDTLEAFWQRGKSQWPVPDVPGDYQVRWIGADAESTDAILTHVKSGDKTGTVSVPAVRQRTGQPGLRPGDALVLIRYDGTPSVLLRITAVEDVAYGSIDERHTALDGPRVRDPEIWKPLHRHYFDMLLAPYGLSTGDDTPITFESFELVYAE